MAIEPTVNAWNVGSIVIELCDRAGVPYDAVQTDLLEGYVEGFSITPDHDAFTGISELCMVYRFDSSNYDSMLNFIPRGADEVASVGMDEILNESYKLTRRDAIMVPRVMHVQYYDVEGGLNTDKQTSDRSLDNRANSEVKTETTVIMPAEQAAQYVAINHKVTIEEQRGEVEFELSDKYLELTTTDIIMLGGERIRIETVEIDGGFQKYTANFDRKSAYSSTVQGVPVQKPLDPPTLIVGETRVEIVDCPILRDADDMLGYYVAICGETLNWTGAVVEVSKDGGQSYTDSAEGFGEAVIGDLVTTLGTHRHEWPDRHNTVRVQLVRDDMELESTDFVGVLNRLNLCIIGNELINFENAEEVEPGVWELSGLLRGRKGTAMMPHAVGERFVLLERSQLFYVAADLFELNRELTFRATSFGLSAGTVTSVLYTGQTQRERQPAYLKTRREGDDTIISWLGIGRLGASANVGMGVHFAGYRLTVGGEVYTTQELSYSVPHPPAGTVVTVRQLNNLTGAGPAATITL